MRKVSRAHFVTRSRTHIIGLCVAKAGLNAHALYLMTVSLKEQQLRGNIQEQADGQIPYQIPENIDVKMYLWSN